MLNTAHRMRRSDQFGQTVRTGVRTGKSTMVVHLASSAGSTNAPLVGFVVSKAIGNAVTRNLVKRRLRAIARTRLTSLPAGSMLVVRALPRAAASDFGSLEKDFNSCVDKVLARGQHDD
ncbi:ribonuclease P protein component [Timonella senegalensis]|uniref:ribonuclease P protein component n=1 Tax=Timonella senegalensis TaxID=1465825 RepID=UPI0009D9BBE1|nr:ribonuclease P protein component [Timonella senegalensis]